MSNRHAVAKAGEIPEGGKKIVRVAAFGKEIEIGVFRVGGEYFAYRNVCPHAGAPVCEGKICGTTLPSKVYEYEYSEEHKVLRCPWHGWEFDLKTGAHLVDEKMKLRGYDVETSKGGTESASGETESAKNETESLESFLVQTEGETVYVLI